MTDDIEIRDGREFRIVRLPEVKPPPKRNPTSRFHFEDVDKPGDRVSFLPPGGPKPPKPKRRRKRGKRS